MIELKDLTKYMQDYLNDLSADIYDGNGPLFNLTPDIQLYQHRDMKMDGKKYTPGIMKVIPSGLIPSTEWGLYTSNYSIEIYGYRSERLQIQKIFNELINQINGKYITIENQNLLIRTFPLDMREFTGSGDGTNTGSFIASVQLEISMAIGGLSPSETNLKINGETVPIENIQYRNDKSLISNNEFNPSNGNTRLINEIFTITFPLGTGNEIIDKILLGHSLNNTYNTKFDFTWDIGGYEKSADYSLRSSFISFSSMNDVIGLTCTFERVLERTIITINGNTLPVVSFSLGKSNTLIPFTDRETMGINSMTSSSSQAISLTIVNDDSDTFKYLTKQIFTPTANRDIIRLGIDEFLDDELNLIISEGEISWTENAALMIMINLVPADTRFTKEG